MYHVTLTDYEEARCRELGVQRNLNCQERNATPNKKDDGHTQEHNHILGVTGEYVMLKALGIGGFDNINMVGRDAEGDITFPNGEKLEVKNTNREGGNFIIPEDKPGGVFDAPYGGLVWPLKVSGQYGVIGWCSRDEYLENSRKVDETTRPKMPKPCWLMEWKKLHPLSELPIHLFRYELTDQKIHTVTS